MTPVAIPGIEAGRTCRANRLPLGRAERQRALADRVGHRADRLAGGDDHHRQHQQRQRHRAGGEDEAEVERPADDEGEPEDAVDDRGHRREVLDVDLDQPVPPARACRRTPRGRARRRCRSGRRRGSRPAISSSEPMIAGRKPAFSGKAVEGGLVIRSRLSAEEPLAKAWTSSATQPGEGDQRPRAAAGRRRPCCGSRRRAAGCAASPASSPGRRPTARRLRGAAAPGAGITRRPRGTCGPA